MDSYLTVGNLSSENLDLFVDGTGMGTIQAGDETTVPVEPGTRSVQVTAKPRQSAPYQIEAETGGTTRLAYAIPRPGAEPEPADRVKFTCFTVSGIVQAAIWLTLAALCLVLIAIGVTSYVEGGKASLSGLLFGFFFCGAVGIWCAVGSRLHLTVTSDHFTVQDDEEKGAFRWDALDQVGIVGEGRSANLVIWRDGAPLTVSPVGRFTHKYSLEQIRGTLHWFAGDRYADQSA